LFSTNYVADKGNLKCGYIYHKPSYYNVMSELLKLADRRLAHIFQEWVVAINLLSGGFKSLWA